MGLNAQQLTDQQKDWLAIIDAGRPAPSPHLSHVRRHSPAVRQPGPGAVLPVRLTRSPHARHAGVAPSFPKGLTVSAFLFRACTRCGRQVPLEHWHDGQPGCDECNRVEWRLRFGVGFALGASIAVAGIAWSALFHWLGWW